MALWDSEQCTFSLALEADYSPTSSLGTSQSVPLSGTPTAARSCESDPQTDGSPVCQCTRETFGCSIHPTTPAEWIASMQASLARILASLDGKPDWKKARAAVCTGKSCASLAWFDRGSSLWKTYQRSLVTDWALYSETWPKWGMTLDGVVYAPLMLERPTNGTDGGCWPTLTICGNYNRKGASKTSGDGLITALRKYPTLLARDSRTVRGGARSMKALGSEPLITVVAELEQQRDGRLNPTWAEWFMGFPMGWTKLSKHSGTHKSRSKRRLRGES